MTLYWITRTPDEPPTFTLMSEAEEATARADANSLFGNENGYPYLLPDDEADAMREMWAASEIVTHAPGPGGKKLA